MNVFMVTVDDGQTYAFNPDAIAWVNGRGRTYTVYLKDGKSIGFSFKTGGTMQDFIEAWDAALHSKADQ